MSKKIISWLDKRKKIKTIELVKRHVKLIIDTVEELSKAITIKKEGDKKLVLASVNLVMEYEREADSLRRQLSLEITQSELPPNEREDFLKLISVIDWIAEWSLEASRILVHTPFQKLSPELINIIFEMIHKGKECVHLVGRCIEKLSEDLQEALKLTDQVERIEEDVDQLYQKARSYYPKLNYQKINPGETILIAHFIEAIENITDWCENTIDQIRLIAIALI